MAGHEIYTMIVESDTSLIMVVRDTDDDHEVDGYRLYIEDGAIHPEELEYEPFPWGTQEASQLWPQLKSFVETGKFTPTPETAADGTDA